MSVQISNINFDGRSLISAHSSGPLPPATIFYNNLIEVSAPYHIVGTAVWFDEAFYGFGQTNSNSYIKSTDDGLTWTTGTIPVTGSWIASATSGASMIILTASGTCLRSTTGSSWTEITFPSVNNLASVAYGNGMYIAVNKSTNDIQISYDEGLTWSESTISSTSSGQVDIVYSTELGKFITGNISATTNGGWITHMSDDGTTWSSSTIDCSQRWTVSPSTMVTGGGTTLGFANGTSYYPSYHPASQNWYLTTNGTTWTSPIMISETNGVSVLLSIYYCGHFIINNDVFSTGSIMSSPTGTSFGNVNIPAGGIASAGCDVGVAGSRSAVIFRRNEVFVIT